MRSSRTVVYLFYLLFIVIFLSLFCVYFLVYFLETFLCFVFKTFLKILFLCIFVETFCMFLFFCVFVIMLILIFHGVWIFEVIILWTKMGCFSNPQLLVEFGRYYENGLLADSPISGRILWILLFEYELFPESPFWSKFIDITVWKLVVSGIPNFWSNFIDITVWKWIVSAIPHFLVEKNAHNYFAHFLGRIFSLSTFFYFLGSSISGWIITFLKWITSF